MVLWPLKNISESCRKIVWPNEFRRKNNGGEKIKNVLIIPEAKLRLMSQFSIKVYIEYTPPNHCFNDDGTLLEHIFLATPKRYVHYTQKNLGNAYLQSASALCVAMIMLYGFSTTCLILWMVYCQTKSSPLVMLQLRNLIGHMCLVVQSMFLMQPYRTDTKTKYLNGRRGWWQIWNSGVNEFRGINWWTMETIFLFAVRIFWRCWLWWGRQCNSTSTHFTLLAWWFCKWDRPHFTMDSWSQQHHLSSGSRCP